MAARFSFLPQRQPIDRPLFHSAVHSHQPAKRPPAFNQDGRFSLFNREKKSAEKRENLDTAKEETPFLRFASEKRRFILPTGTTSLNPQCRKVGIAVIGHRRDIEDKVLWKTKNLFPFPFSLQCLAWKESCGCRFTLLQRSSRITNTYKSALRHCENAWRRRELLRCPQRSFRVNFLCCAMPHSGNAG